MVPLIDDEPTPRLPGKSASRLSIAEASFHPLPTPRPLSEVAFSAVLEARQSAVSGPVSPLLLGTLLWELMRLRRTGQGRFGTAWEGRAAPSAGGLHVISILVISDDVTLPVGLYDADRHGISVMSGAEQLRAENSDNISLLSSARSGTTLQFLADVARLESCYDKSESLLWRDSGALAASVCFIATSLGLTSVTLGRTGSRLLNRLPSNPGFIAAGAVHLGDPNA